MNCNHKFQGKPDGKFYCINCGLQHPGNTVTINRDEIDNLRYELFHITAERDQLAIKLTRWEESWMAKELEQQKTEIERLKKYINSLHKSISKI